ncbi:MAG: hypothetical protein Q4D19_11770 [Lautropia sp.]|nr:hypothetical protein [Lautropia sp.]
MKPKHPMRWMATAAMMLFSVQAHAIELDAGGEKIEIPAPPGYVLLTPEMKLPHNAMLTLMSRHDVRATFIPEIVATSLKKGKAIGFNQFYTVSISEKNARRRADPAAIQRLTDWARNQRQSSADMEELPVHTENAQMVGFSSLLTRTAPDKDKPASTAILSTTMLQVKERIISLDVVDSGNDLYWAQSTSRQWAESIISANQSTQASPR